MSHHHSLSLFKAQIQEHFPSLLDLEIDPNPGRSWLHTCRGTHPTIGPVEIQQVILSPGDIRPYPNPWLIHCNGLEVVGQDCRDLMEKWQGNEDGC